MLQVSLGFLTLPQSTGSPNLGFKISCSERKACSPGACSLISPQVFTFLSHNTVKWKWHTGFQALIFGLCNTTWERTELWLLPRNLWDRLRCVVWSWLPVLVRKTKHSISSRRESTVWIFLPSFFSPIIKIFLGEIWLGKNFTFLWKNPTDRRLPHSNVSDLRDNQPCPCWLSVYLLPIIWKATALVLSMTAWPHLVRRESELQRHHA